MSATNLARGETFVIDLGRGEGVQVARVLCVMPAGNDDIVSFCVSSEPCVRPCKGQCDRGRKCLGFFHEEAGGESSHLVQRLGTKITGPKVGKW